MGDLGRDQFGKKRRSPRKALKALRPEFAPLMQRVDDEHGTAAVIAAFMSIARMLFTRGVTEWNWPASSPTPSSRR